MARIRWTMRAADELEAAASYVAQGPQDVWQQDDLLSFANFFMGVRTVGFQGENEKRYPEEHALFKRHSAGKLYRPGDSSRQGHDQAGPGPVETWQESGRDRPGGFLDARPV